MDELDNIKITVGEGGGFDALPEDVYETMIENIKAEMKPNPFKEGKEELSLNFTFAITEGEHSGRKLFRRMSPHISIGKPSNLFKLVNAIEGKTLDGDYFEGFKLSKLLGRFVRVTVKNKVVGENTYSNIESFLQSKMDNKIAAPAKRETKDQTNEEIADELLKGKL